MENTINKQILKTDVKWTCIVEDGFSTMNYFKLRTMGHYNKNDKRCRETNHKTKTQHLLRIGKDAPTHQ